MKIYLNSAYSIVKIEDSKFVANSAGFNNLIQYFFVNDNGEVYQNTDPSYVGLAFRKADGNKIFERRATIANVTEGYCWQYTTAENDGVLSVKGALEISAQFVKTTIVNDEIASRDIQGVAVVTAYVMDNIGQADEDWYAANSANNQAQHDALQSQITTNTNDLTVVKTQVATNTLNIAINSGDIEDNNQDITNIDTRVTALENNIAYPETPIGQLTGAALPTNAELTAFVVSIVSRQPRHNDTVIYVLTIAGGTDRNYKYVYSVSGWRGYELPAIEKAGNGTPGLIQGTYGIGSTANTLVSIISGNISAIYIKTTSGAYIDIRTLINTTYDTQVNILAGTQNVGQALKTIADQLGNVINTYYLSVDAGATKQYVKDYSLPKSFANVYYYQSDGNNGLEFSDNIPTSPISGIQMIFAGTTAAEQSIVSITRSLQYDYVFSKNNTYNSKFYIASSVGATVKFKLTTTVLDNETPAGAIATLDTAITDYITLTADEITAIDFQSNFNSLGGLEANCPAGSRYLQRLSIIKDGTFSTAPTLTIYCNSTYPSAFNLNATSVVQIVNYIGSPKEVIVEPSAWAYNSSNDMWEAEIAPTTHEQPTGYRYLINFYEVTSATSRGLIDVYPSIADDATITLYAQSQPTSNIVMVIASSVANSEKGILLLTNPEELTGINYNTYGTIKITQTEEAVALSLPAPIDTSKSYRIFIVNDNTSTENITINTETIEAGNSIQFVWAGQWYRGETLVNVSEIYDDRESQILSITLNNIDMAVTNAENAANAAQATADSKLSTDMGNVNIVGLEEKIEDTNVFDYDYIEVTDDYTLTNTDYNHIVFVAQFTADNQKITLTLPDDNFIKEIILRNIMTTYKNCELILAPASGVYINGAPLSITVTQDDWCGTLYYYTNEKTGINGFQYIEQVTAKITVNNTVVTGIDVSSSDSGLEATINNDIATIKIKPEVQTAYIDNAFAAEIAMPKVIKDSTNAYIDGAIWFDRFDYNKSPYISADRDTKTITLQDASTTDDPNISGGTPYAIAIDMPFSIKTAPSDGIIRYLIVNASTGAVLTDINGNPIGVENYYKSGDLLRRIFDGFIIKSINTSFKIIVEHTFNSLIEVDRGAGIAIQALTEDKKVSSAWADFNTRHGLRWLFDDRYYYGDLLDIDWSGKQIISTETLTAGAYNYLDGLHLDVINNSLAVTATGTGMLFEAIDANMGFFAWGKTFDATDTQNIKNKGGALTVTRIGNTGAFSIACAIGVLGYTGSVQGDFTTPIITGISNEQITLGSGWSQLALSGSTTEFELTADKLTDTFNITIPSGTYNRIFVYIRPLDEQNPNSLKLSSFTFNLTTGFDRHYMETDITAREEHLRYNNQYAKFKFDNQGYAVIQYTINSTSTKLPFGYKISGAANISLVGAWVDNPHLKGEGVLNFAERSTGTFYMKIPVKRFSGAVAGSDETLTLQLYRRTLGSNTDPFDITDFTAISGTDKTFVLTDNTGKPNIDNLTYLRYTADYTLNQTNESILLVGTSTHDNGCAIYITSGKPLTTDVSGTEIV